MPLVRLLDGREVPSDSAEWKAECMARYHYVEGMFRLRTRDRRASYLATIERREGPALAARVRAEVERQWKLYKK